MGRAWGAAALSEPYAGRLGAKRMAHNNFSFKKFDDLDLSNANALFGEAAEIFVANPKIVDEAMRA